MMAKRILIVEDDADAAGVVGAYLRRDGFDVAFAEDGKRGVEMHAQWKPDLVLLDVMLPKLSGTDVLSAIRRSSNMTLPRFHVHQTYAAFRLRSKSAGDR